MSPRPEPSLGFFLIPFLIHILGRILGLPIVFPINVLGAKGCNASHVELFRELVLALEITPEKEWCDSNFEWNTLLPPVFSKGIEHGWIQRGTVSIFTCPCGKTEFLNTPINLVCGKFDRKVYEVKNGMPSCLLCGESARAYDRDTLLLALPRRIPAVKLIPHYATNAWLDLSENLSGCKIPISRTRETGLLVSIGETQFNIDIDITWMLYPYLLREWEMEVGTLVSGHKTLKQAFMASVASNLLGVPYPETIVSAPYFSLDFGNREPLNAKGILEKFGPSIARVLLLFGLGNERKDVIVPSRTIHLVQHSVRIDPELLVDTPSQKAHPEEIWDTFNGQKLQNALASLRRKHPEEISTLIRRILAVALLPQSKP